MTDAAETESNRLIVNDFIDLFYTQHRVKEAYEKYVEPSYIQHNPMAADVATWLSPFWCRCSPSRASDTT